MLPTLFGLTFLVFMMVRLYPGDVLAIIAGDFGAVSQETKDAILADFRLDKNIPQQYVLWLGDLVRGDLGNSLVSGRSVRSELANRLPSNSTPAPGDVLIVPRLNRRRHVSGDTLESLCREEYGDTELKTRMSVVAAANHIGEPESLFSNQVVYFPG